MRTCKIKIVHSAGEFPLDKTLCNKSGTFTEFAIDITPVEKDVHNVENPCKGGIAAGEGYLSARSKEMQNACKRTGRKRTDPVGNVQEKRRRQCSP